MNYTKNKPYSWELLTYCSACIFLLSYIRVGCTHRACFEGLPSLPRTHQQVHQHITAPLVQSQLCGMSRFLELLSSFLQKIIINKYFQILQSDQVISDIEFHKNKTSIQWTPGSQIYLSSLKIIFDQKKFLNKKIKKCINHA